MVPVGTVDRLTIVFVATYIVLGAMGVFLFTRFPFGRAGDDARLTRVAADVELEGAPHAP